MSRQYGVAIIGAGISGLTLALALANSSIPCTVYEARSPLFEVGGDVTLTPNALRILDRIGIYQRISDYGFQFDRFALVNGEGTVLTSMLYGSWKKYGYSALSISRQVLMNVLRSMVRANDIPVFYNTKFKRALDETTTDILLEFDDESIATASLLIGADGAGSSVRNCLRPGPPPQPTECTRFVETTCTYLRSELQLPRDFHLPCAIQSSNTIFVNTNNAEGSEISFTRYLRFEKRALNQSERVEVYKEPALQALRADIESRFDILGSAAKEAVPHSTNVWPIETGMDLAQWTSLRGRVILVGNAAHSNPLARAHATSLAIEDAHLFAMLLSTVSGGHFPLDGVQFWEKCRRRRIEEVFTLLSRLNRIITRNPSETPPKDHAAPLVFSQLSRVLGYDFNGDLSEWLEPELRLSAQSPPDSKDNKTAECLQKSGNDDRPPSYSSINLGRVKTDVLSHANNKIPELNANAQPQPTSQPTSPQKNRNSIYSWFHKDPAERVKYDQRLRQRDDDERVETLLNSYLGPANSPHRQLIAGYWQATRMESHWKRLLLEEPQRFKVMLDQGYCTPIPLSWQHNQHLTMPTQEPTDFINRAEQRLYYLLQNQDPLPGMQPSTHLRPMHHPQDSVEIYRQGRQRSALACPIDSEKLAHCASIHDAWRMDPLIKSYDYSPQVDSFWYGPSQQQNAAPVPCTCGRPPRYSKHMILIDTSRNMAMHPTNGHEEKDGTTHYADQSPHLLVVKQLIERSRLDLILRFLSMNEIEIFTFSKNSRHVGRMTCGNNEQILDKIYADMSKNETRIMPAWRKARDMFIRQQNALFGKGYFFYPSYGWQIVPDNWAKPLDLLIFLGSDVEDMAEFEQDLLGRSWAHVTIVLLGLEASPLHHFRALELERMTKSNNRVRVIDVQGRICEKLVAKAFLQAQRCEFCSGDSPALLGEVSDPAFAIS